TSLLCEHNHMGSLVVLVLFRSAVVVLARFGIDSDTPGICYTRRGRRFFSDEALERELLSRLNEAMTASGLWDKLQTGWVCLDCELMPWSQKRSEEHTSE